MRTFALIVFGILLLLAIILGSISMFGDDDPAEHIYDRPWVTVMPESPKSNTHVLFLSNDNPYGATVHGSSYRHVANLVTHELEGNKLEVTSLQDGRRANALVKTWECDEAPGELDLCLDLNVGPAKIRMYSQEAWRRGEDVPAGVVQTADMDWPSTPPGEIAAQKQGLPSWFRTAAQ